MTRVFSTVPALMLALILSGCGGGATHEALADQTVGVFKNMVTSMEGIKDKASWETAKPKLTKLVDQLKTIGTSLKKLGEPTAEAKKALDAKMEKEMGALLPKLMGMGKNFASDKDLTAEVQGFMQNLMKDMPKFK